MSYQRRAGKRSGHAFHWYAEGLRCFGGTGRGWVGRPKNQT